MSKPTMISAAEAAEMLAIPRTRIKQLDSEAALVTVVRDGKTHLPKEFLVETEQGWGLLDNLRGTVTLLRDAGFTGEEIITWLFTESDEVGGTPIDVLRAGSTRSVNRVAQTLGF